jgi:triosephosphate isomerase (TIM)
MAGMRRPVVAGNWKMNGTAASIGALLDGMLPRLEAGCDLAVFPPAVYLPLVHERVRGTAIRVGAQNIHAEPRGAYTGEIAAEMVRDLGGGWVLVGHSERRQHFGESDTQVAAKFRAAQRAGLTPVLCVGETLAQREAGSAIDVVLGQIGAVLAAAGVVALHDALIAYEPVWAIGTGRNAAPADAQEMHAAIRSHLQAEDAAVAAGIRILYGGSVTGDNAGALFAQADVDGGLVGGASLDADQFVRIMEAANVKGFG